MLRILFAVFVVLVAAAVLTRSPRIKRIVWALVGVVVLYGVLKITGVIEAIAPSRN